MFDTSQVSKIRWWYLPHVYETTIVRRVGKEKQRLLIDYEVLLYVVSQCIEKVLCTEHGIEKKHKGRFGGKVAYSFVLSITKLT